MNYLIGIWDIMGQKFGKTGVPVIEYFGSAGKIRFTIYNANFRLNRIWLEKMFELSFEAYFEGWEVKFQASPYSGAFENFEAHIAHMI